MKDRFEGLRKKVVEKKRITAKDGVRCLSGARLTSHNDFDVGELLDDLVRREIHGPWTRTIGVYHPSSLEPGVCMRLLYYDRIGTTPRPSHNIPLQSIFDEGHGTHEIIQRRFRTMHKGFSDECTIQIPRLHVAGSTDGVFEVEDWLLEIKTAGESTFSTLVKPKVEHIWQLHLYMYAMDVPRGQLLYVNRNNGAKRTFKVFFSQAIWEAIEAKIATVEEHVRKEEPPVGVDVPYKCNTCKFQYCCKL